MPTHTVADAANGQRLDQFLRTVQSQYSRAYLQKLVEEKRVLVNGKPSKPSHRVRAGDAVSVEIPAPRSLEAKPEAIPLDILHEDDELIVVNKPAGMVVHPAAGNFQGTLVNALLHHCRGKLAGIGGVMRPGIVHRLDRGTSGCIVVAKTDSAHQGLVAQFRARTVKKVYRALCWGKFDRVSGRVETTIGRSVHDRKKMSARAPRGRAASTEFRVLKQLGEFALVELQIHTGRTHQIRVHMAHLGHPVVGDRVYGRVRKTEISVARPMLHAYKLGFAHPRTGKPMEFTAPIPDDFGELCKN